MRAIFHRELIVIARQPAIAVAGAVHLVLVAAFAILWRDGVPVLPGSNVYDQARLIQSAILMVLLPWAAARSAATDQGNDLVLLSAVTALRPSRVLAAKTIAIFGALALIVFGAVPAVTIVRQIAAVPPARALFDSLSLLGVAMLVAALTVSWTAIVRGRLTIWVTATGSTAAAMTVLLRSSSPEATGAIAVAFAAIVIAGVGAWLDRSTRYMADAAC